MVVLRFAENFCAIVLVFYLTAVLGDYAGCPTEFQEMCECGYIPYGPEKRITFVTNCTNAGFDNSIMLRKLPPQTEVLIFVGNEIADLPLNIFDLDVVYDKLHTIDLSNNHIQSIKGRTFHNVANVTKLILNDNDIYIVFRDHHPRMFSNFKQLVELHLRNAFTEKVHSGKYLNNLVEIFENSTLNHLKVLNMENNEISQISYGEFCSLPALEELYLANNHMTDIALNFSCLNKLKKLDVGNNFIQSLSNRTLKHMEQLPNIQLNLTANPFKCDCNMVETYEWMVTTPITLIDRESYHCYDGLPSNIGKHIFAVPVDKLQCVMAKSHFEYHTSASVITLIIGLVCLTAVIAVLIYKNKKTVGKFVGRIADPIRNKFYYVSLDRSETTMAV